MSASCCSPEPPALEEGLRRALWIALVVNACFGTGTAWPYLLVAALMAALAISGAATVLRQARVELRGGLAR